MHFWVLLMVTGFQLGLALYRVIFFRKVPIADLSRNFRRFAATTSTISFLVLAVLLFRS